MMETLGGRTSADWHPPVIGGANTADHSTETVSLSVDSPHCPKLTALEPVVSVPLLEGATSPQYRAHSLVLRATAAATASNQPLRLCILGLPSAARDLSAYQAICARNGISINQLCVEWSSVLLNPFGACKSPAPNVNAVHTAAFSAKARHARFNSYATSRSKILTQQALRILPGGVLGASASQVRPPWMVRSCSIMTHVYCPALNVCGFRRDAWASFKSFVMSLAVRTSYQSPHATLKSHFQPHDLHSSDQKKRHYGDDIPFHTLILEDLDRISPLFQRRLIALLHSLRMPTSSVSGLGWVVIARVASGLAANIRDSSTCVRFPMPRDEELATFVSGVEAVDGEGWENCTLPKLVNNGSGARSRVDCTKTASIHYFTKLQRGSFDCISPSVTALYGSRRRYLSHNAYGPRSLAVAQGEARAPEFTNSVLTSGNEAVVGYSGKKRDPGGFARYRIAVNKSDADACGLNGGSTKPASPDILPLKDTRSGVAFATWWTTGYTPSTVPRVQAMRRLARVLMNKPLTVKRLQYLRGIWSEILATESDCVIYELNTILLRLGGYLFSERPNDEAFRICITHLLADTAAEISRAEMSLHILPTLESLMVKIFGLRRPSDGATDGCISIMHRRTDAHASHDADSIKAIAVADDKARRAHMMDTAALQYVTSEGIGYSRESTTVKASNIDDGSSGDLPNRNVIKTVIAKEDESSLLEDVHLLFGPNEG